MKKFTVLMLTLALINGMPVSSQITDSLRHQIKLMADENDPVRSRSMMQMIIQNNHLQADEDAETIDMLKGNLAMDYLEAGEYSAFDQTIASMKNKFNQTSFLSMAASTLITNNKDLKIAEAMAKQTLDLYFSYKDDPEAKPNNFSDEDWNRFMSFAYYPYSDTYAMALYAVGKYEEALKYQEIAINGSPENSLSSSVERYANLLVLNKQDEKAYILLMNMVETGRSTAAMNSLFKELYLKKNPDPKGYDDFYANLQKNVIATLKENLKSKMQNIEAYEFTLKDLDGKTVALSDYRGKTVVIDFWATWCVPCLASFPAMSKVVKSHPEVKFLFIATQEKQEIALERVTNYITKSQYLFYVLMDEPVKDNPGMFVALSGYKPQGIPAKVVIDARGRQRFLSTGFTSDTELINEMEAMIQLVAEEN